VTLLISVLTRSRVLQVADHRLTRGTAIVADHSLKQVRIGGTDGPAVVGYAGIGMVGKTPISTWVRQVLRSADRTIQEHVYELMQASNRRLVEHSRTVGAPHTFSVASFSARGPELYIVTNRIRGRTGRAALGRKFHWVRAELARLARCPAIIHIEGSGMSALPEREARPLILGVLRQRRRKPTCLRDVAAMLAYRRGWVGEHQQATATVATSNG
jgi:hypothetical protein